MMVVCVDLPLIEHPVGIVIPALRLYVPGRINIVYAPPPAAAAVTAALTVKYGKPPMDAVESLP
jgi:hypothetical protein